jgi:hypothetical protein
VIQVDFNDNYQKYVHEMIYLNVVLQLVDDISCIPVRMYTKGLVVVPLPLFVLPVQVANVDGLF